MIDAVIPARNEQDSIGPIVRAFKGTHGIGQVIVSIDADTSDGTAEIAGNNGAIVIPGKYRGKGQVAKLGLSYVDTESVLFCDADYRGLTTAHIQRIIEGEEKHIIGVPDLPLDDILNSDAVREKPDWFMRIIESWQYVSGIRKVPVSVIRHITLHGYLMETQINQGCLNAGIRPVFVMLRGLYSPFHMTTQRREEMLRDRAWGMGHGIFDAPS
jgi:hypothetical protein